MLDLTVMKEWISYQQSIKKKLREEGPKKKRHDVINASKKIAEKWLRGDFEQESTFGLEQAIQWFSTLTDSTIDSTNLKLENFWAKYGIDPNKTSAHIGHLLMPYRLAELQESGVNIYLLMGTFTARFGGDPEGRKNDRPIMTFNQVLENAEKVVRNIMPILDSKKTKIVYNHEWYDNMSVSAFDYLCRALPLSTLMQRKNFKERDSMSANVWLYPALQAIDSLILGTFIGAGGKDQWLNESGAREIQRKLEIEEQLLLLAPLVMGTDANPKIKMSSSAKNTVEITDPLDMYASLRESMISHPILIAHIGNLYPNVELPSKIEKKDVLKWAKRIAEEITRVYWGEDITNQVTKMYDDRIGYWTKLSKNKRISGISLDIEEQIKESKKTISPYELLMSKIGNTNYKKILRSDIEIEGNWSDNLIKKLHAGDNRKTIVLYFDSNHNQLHLGHIAALDEAKRLQKEKGYFVKIIFGDYTTGNKKEEKNIDASAKVIESTNNANLLEEYIHKFNLLDEKNTEFYHSSSWWNSMTVKSLAEIYTKIDIKKLANMGLVNLRQDNTEKSVLDAQLDIRQAIDVLMAAGNSDTTVLNVANLSPYVSIAKKLFEDLNLSLSVHTIDNIVPGTDGRPMSHIFNNSVNIDSIDQVEVYRNLMRLPDKNRRGDNLLEKVYYKLGLSNLDKVSDKRAIYLNRLDNKPGIHDEISTRNAIENMMNMALSIVSRFYGIEKGIQAEEAFIDSQLKLTAKTIDLEPGDYSIFFLCNEANPNISKNKIQHLISQNAITIDDKLINPYKVDGDIKVYFESGNHVITAGRPVERRIKEAGNYLLIDLVKLAYPNEDYTNDEINELFKNGSILINGIVPNAIGDNLRISMKAGKFSLLVNESKSIQIDESGVYSLVNLTGLQKGKLSEYMSKDGFAINGKKIESIIISEDLLVHLDPGKHYLEIGKGKSGSIYLEVK